MTRPPPERWAEIERLLDAALELPPEERGPWLERVCAHPACREPDLALDQLESLVKVPYWLSPGWLRVDPNFASLRGNARFQRLVNRS